MGQADADCLAYCVSLADGPQLVPSSLAALPPFAILAGAVRALAALDAAREAADDEGIRIEHLARYRAEPGEVIVAFAPSTMRSEDRDEMRTELTRVFKDQAILVSCGVGIEVVRAAEVEPPLIVDRSGERGARPYSSAENGAP